jgi:hypothetical protein
MPVINSKNAKALNPACYEKNYATQWRPTYRIDSVGGDVHEINKAVQELHFEKLIFAEGDSWFDKFTPITKSGTNLLDALRLPYYTGVVDVAHIGDISSDMVAGHQREQTETIFKLHGFDAIIFSGGGNDLKNLFAELYRGNVNPKLKHPAVANTGKYVAPDDDQFFDDVIDNIKAFVALRDASPQIKTRSAPIFVNGYDYLQPRPVKGAIFGGMLKTAGPWLYPSMLKAGLTDSEMLTACSIAIDKLNSRLSSDIATLPNVYVMDQRGLLEVAQPKTKTASGDYLDEIHPTALGFTKLSRNRWDHALAKALGWVAKPGEEISPAG